MIRQSRDGKVILRSTALIVFSYHSAVGWPFSDSFCHGRRTLRNNRWYGCHGTCTRYANQRRQTLQKITVHVVHAKANVTQNNVLATQSTSTLWHTTSTFRKTIVHVSLLGKEESPVFRVVEPAAGAGARQQMTVGPGAAKIRPYVVCAVLRAVKFDAKSYKSFMDLQASFDAGLAVGALLRYLEEVTLQFYIGYSMRVDICCLLLLTIRYDNGGGGGVFVFFFNEAKGKFLIFCVYFVGQRAVAVDFRC